MAIYHTILCINMHISSHTYVHGMYVTIIVYSMYLKNATYFYIILQSGRTALSLAQENLRYSNAIQSYVEIVASILRESEWRRVKNFVVFLHRGSYSFNKACIRVFFFLEMYKGTLSFYKGIS